MGKRTPRKSKEQIAAELIARRAKNLEAVGMQPEAASLQQHQAVEVTRMAEEHGEGKKRAGHDVARRVDAFSALRDGMDVGCYDACRRFEQALLNRRGEGDKGSRVERMDGEQGRDLTDIIVEAGQTVEYVKVRLSRRDFWLLHELVLPSIEREGGWRGDVAYITGEANWNAQGAVVRAASLNLRDALEELDMAPSKAA